MDKLHAQPSLLEAAGFIQPSGDESERAYTFRHALQHDAAYQSLLKHSRRDLHLSVGLTLERLFPDRLSELAPDLATHFAEADDSARALMYSTRAAERAAAELSLAQGNAEAAAAALEPTIADLRRLGHRYQLPSLLHLLGLSQLRQHYLNQAEASLTEARADAEERRAHALLWPILAALAEVADRRGDTTTTHTLRAKAAAIIMRLADAISDSKLRATFLAQTEILR